MEVSRALKKAYEVLEERDETCPSHGPFKSKLMRVYGQQKPWTTCQDCGAEEFKRIQLRDAVDMLSIRAQVPPRFASSTFENYGAQLEGQRRALQICQDYASRYSEVAKTGQCLILAGKPGTGKTHLAAAIANNLLERLIPVKYSSALRLIREVRATWGGSGSEDKVIESMASVGLLIMDEVGVQYGTDAETVMLFEILNARYEQVRPSVVVTNQSVDGLKTYLGDRSFDRLREGGGKLVVFDWESHRKGN